MDLKLLILLLSKIALANICAMKADTNDRYYNVGTGIRTSLKELAEMIVEITEYKK